VLVDQTRWDLEMTDPAALRPSGAPAVPVSVVRCELPAPEFVRFLHSAVGFRWHWTSRLAWDYQEWLDWLARPEVETWVAHVAGAPAGFFELEAEGDGDVQVNSFGLLSPFHGLGIGGFVLTRAVERAWELHGALGGRTRRVWLHTNSLDGPHALDNYRARGFTVAREHRLQRELPDDPPQPWPGAGWRPGLEAPGPVLPDGADQARSAST
jgi:GNAT superfamily N-acetyltransferase